MPKQFESGAKIITLLEQLIPLKLPDNVILIHK